MGTSVYGVKEGGNIEGDEKDSDARSEAIPVGGLLADIDVPDIDGESEYWRLSDIPIDAEVKM